MQKQRKQDGGGPDNDQALELVDRSKDIPDITKTIEGIEGILEQRDAMYDELVCPVCGLPCSDCSVACDLDAAVPFGAFLEGEYGQAIQNNEGGAEQIEFLKENIRKNLNHRDNVDARRRKAEQEG